MQNSFLVTNANLDIVDVNTVFCELTGYSREELLKMNVSQFDALLSFDEIKLNLETALKSGISHFETRNSRKDGTFLDVEVNLTKIEIDGKLYFASFGRDITPRKEAERKLKENEKQLSSAAHIARLAYWEYDVPNRMFTFNDQFYEIFKVKVEDIGTYQITAMRYEDLFIYPDDKEMVRNETVKAVKSSDPNYNYRFEYRILFPQGMIGHVAVHYFITKDASGKTIKVFGTIQDISDQKNAAAALLEMEQKMAYQKVQEQKQITRAILSAQEKERNRLGQEIHDNVCQILTGAKLHLIRTSKQIGQQLDYPIELIVTSIDELRSISSENVTPLKDLGLKELIHSLIDNLSHTSTIKIDFRYDLDSCDIDEDLKLNIYRIIQEQLTNIVKHADASGTTIVLQANNDTIDLVITDNGKGFDASQKRPGIGISNIINRVECFNGKIIIDSSPGKGCTMKIEYPCKEL